MVRVVEVDIVEVLVKGKLTRKSKKILFKRAKTSMSLHRGDVFARRSWVSNQMYTFKWLQSKFRNLHKDKIRVCGGSLPRLPEALVIRKIKGKFVTSGYFYGIKLSTMETALNASFEYTMHHVDNPNDYNKLNCHFLAVPTIIPANSISKGRPDNYYHYSKFYAAMKVNSIYKEVALVPTRFEQKNVFNAHLLCHLLFFIGAIFLAFWLFVTLVHFDHQTWNFLMMFGTMIGISVDRNLITRHERSLYLCIFVVGFFCSGDIFTSTMEIVYPERNEIRVNDFFDLNKTELPIYMYRKTVGAMELTDDDGKLIMIYKKVKFHDADNAGWCILRLLKNKNVSCVVLMTDVPIVLKFSQFQLSTSATPTVRETPINFVVSAMTQLITPWCCYYHRFSEFNWRFEESGHQARYVKIVTMANRLNFMWRNFAKDRREIDEFEDISEDEVVVLSKLSILLVIGYILSLIALAIERISFVKRQFSQDKDCDFPK